MAIDAAAGMPISSNINFTDSAAEKVWELLLDEGDTDLNLRAYITGGGCSGFQYGFTFDTEVNEDDVVIQKTVGDATVTLVIDAMSHQYLSGAKIDYKEDVDGAQFVITNPNAKTTCGCGSSFAV